MTLRIYPSTAAHAAAADALTPYEQVLEALLYEAQDAITDAQNVFALAAEQENETVQQQIGMAVMLVLGRFPALKRALIGTALRAAYGLAKCEADAADPEEGQTLTPREWVELGEEIEGRIQSGLY